MKRTLLALLCAALTVPALAQYNRPRPQQPQHHNRYDHTDTEIYYGLRLGLALSSVNSDDQRLNGSGTQSGLNFGAAMGFGLSNSVPVFLETGLYYTEKGGKGTNNGTKFTYDLNYLELPVVVKYGIELDNDFTLQPFVGGYFGIGISGKVKNFAERAATSSFDSEYFKRLDGGLRLGCGVEYQMMYAELAYDLGLANICHDDFDTSHNRCLYLNIGVNF
ncbi:MAG: PorT family protein [Prevotella sp.]|nr:PorT family protein [Prevotella sp.]